MRYEQRGKTEIFFSNLLLKIGGRKNEKSGEEKFSVLATAERSGVVGAIRVTTSPNAYG